MRTLYESYIQEGYSAFILVVASLLCVVTIALVLGTVNAELWLRKKLNYKFKTIQMISVGIVSIVLNHFYVGNHYTFVLVWWALHWIIFESTMYAVVNSTKELPKHIPFGYSGTESVIDLFFRKLGSIGVKKDYPDTNNKIYRNSITYKRVAYFLLLFITIPLWAITQFNL